MAPVGTAVGLTEIAHDEETPARRPRQRPPETAGRTAWLRRYLASILVADLAVALGAGLLALYTRFGPDVASPGDAYRSVTAFLPCALVLALAVSHAYEPRYLFVGTEEYERVLRACVGLTATVAVGSYVFDIPLSRGYVLVALPACTLGCLAVRYLLRLHLHRARAHGRCMRRVLVVGHAAAVADITRTLRRERSHGFQVVGACVPFAGTGPTMVGGVDVPILGTFETIADTVAVARADTVLVLSCPELDGLALRRLAWRVEADDVDLIVASSLVDVAGGRTTIRPVDGLPMVHVEHPTLSGARRTVKALYDRAGALVLILVLLPFLVGIAMAILINSGRPVLFRQTRVGRDGQPFTMLKFRTMCPDAPARLAQLRAENEAAGVLFKLRRDPRVTGVGRWLRRFSLDELPQLINVVRGDMSLVGPRPPLPEEVADYPQDVRRRLVVRPGMTGLWQVSGRSDLSWEEAVRLDLGYVDNWTLCLDLVILLRTVLAVVRPSGAY